MSKRNFGVSGSSRRDVLHASRPLGELPSGSSLLSSSHREAAMTGFLVVFAIGFLAVFGVLCFLASLVIDLNYAA